MRDVVKAVVKAKMATPLPVAPVKPTRNAQDEIEHRRRCVEQAIRWPVSSASYGSQAYQNSPYPQPQPEPDILARAQRVYAWTTAT